MDSKLAKPSLLPKYLLSLLEKFLVSVISQMMSLRGTRLYFLDEANIQTFPLYAFHL